MLKKSALNVLLIGCLSFSFVPRVSAQPQAKNGDGAAKKRVPISGIFILISGGALLGIYMIYNNRKNLNQL